MQIHSLSPVDLFPLLLGKMLKRDVNNWSFSCKFTEFDATDASFEMSDSRYHSISTHLDCFSKKTKQNKKTLSLFNEILSAMEHKIRHFKLTSCHSLASNGIE